MDESLKVGRSTPRFDAPGKVAGTEKYAADYYPKNFLVAGLVRSPHAHAKILDIDISEAKALKGVTAVLTHFDVKGSNRLGIVVKDQPILAKDIVRFIGDAVALVLADNCSVLEEAIAKIQVSYEILPGIFHPRDAISNDALKIHEEWKNGNILLDGKIEVGNVKNTLAFCAHKTAIELKLGCQEHACLETEVGVAMLDTDGNLVITASTQSPFRDKSELACALNLSPERIHIIAPHIGGAFGRKDGITVQGYLALGALNSGGRPVRMQFSREESTVTGTKRHAAEVQIELGCDEKGRLSALHCNILMDTGAYASFGGEVLTLALEHAGGPYSIPNVTIEGKVVYTNNVPAGAFRGFGVPQVTACLEQAIDELAKTVKIDPLEFRLLNAVRQGEKNSAGVHMTQSVGLTECLEAIADSPEWKERHVWLNSAAPFTRRGVGLVAVHHAQGFGPLVPDTATAKIELGEDGCFIIYAGVADMGQGNTTTYLQMAGDILRQGFDRLKLVLPDTQKTLSSCSSSSSRTTFTFGNAIIGAAKLLAERILNRACLMLPFQSPPRINKEELRLLPGRVQHIPSGCEFSLKSLASRMEKSERVSLYSYTCPTNVQDTSFVKNLALHGYPHRVYSFCVQLVRLHVDTCSGEITIDDILSCIDAGCVINPKLLEQQIEGAIAQGIGYTLCEKLVLEKGEVLSKDFSTYLIPTALDMPELRTIMLSIEEKDGPFGMKGAGEIGLAGILPAVGNALHGITGRRLLKNPIDRGQVIEVLKLSGLNCEK